MKHDLKRFTRLKRIIYKNGPGLSDNSLSGIQLEFTAGFKSPFFNNKLCAKDQGGGITVDTSKKIKEVSFYLDQRTTGRSDGFSVGSRVGK